MFFENRPYKIYEETDAAVLAEKLAAGRTWCLCNGFKYKDVWFLNDSTSEDGAQEYAALIQGVDGTFFQVESITFSWCSVEQATEHIDDCVAYVSDPSAAPIFKQKSVHFSHVAGSCRYCQ